MKSADIGPLRLHNQHLTGSPLKHPRDVVALLGAVQAQDFAAAKWALGLRIQNATDATVERAFNNGEILRTHVMRPTWHFVLPEDIYWMQDLTAARVKTFLSHYNRKLELDDALLRKSNAVIVKSLQKHTYLTRQELKGILERIGITTNVQRLAHIIMWAELEALICSGPLRLRSGQARGGQFTYALLEERVPKVKKMRKDEALATLTLKYFTSHGPAQLKDFAWWSGLLARDAQKGIDMVKSTLATETVEEKTYWFSAGTVVEKERTSHAFLLSIYDEYTIAYKDRSALGGEKYVEKFLAMGNALTAVILLDGKIIGTWRRVLKKASGDISLNMFQKLTATQQKAIGRAINRYSQFLNLPVTCK